ncbi:MAG: arginyltransferase [Xanthomonadales bacterium]|nr:arginyltransferase [Xanthomonadales bacterium]
MAEAGPAPVAELASWPYLPLPCAYFPGRRARLRVGIPERPTPGTVDALLAAGLRRDGLLWFRPECPRCAACVALRIPVADYRPDRRARRCLARNRDLELRLRPLADWGGEHEALMRRYLAVRHPDSPMRAQPPEAWGPHFRGGSASAALLEARLGGRLLAAMVVDRGARSLSAVYACFEPEQERRSLGRLLILSLIAAARERGLDHVYLGYWIAGHPRMRYKAEYRPHERLGPEGWFRPEES